MNLDKNFKFGELIARKRIQLNMTQNELAEGICSIPYISKLENGKLPNENNHIVSLLFLKLKINIEQYLKELNDTYILIETIFKNINRKNSEAYEYYWEKLEAEKQKFDHQYLNIGFLLIEMRYQIEKNNLNIATTIRDEINCFYKTLSQKQTYYFLYFSGLLFSKENKISKGIEFFEAALNVKVEYSVDDDNSIYYHLALAYSVSNVPSLALYYANEALSLMQDQLDFTNVINCRLILGINYIRIKQYNKAMEYFHQILDVSIGYKNKSLISKVHHNIGYLYSKKGDSELAILNYMQSLEFKDYQTELYINTIYFIILEYIKLNNIEKANYFINQVMNNADTTKNHESFVKVKILKYKLDNVSQELEDYIINVANPLFEQNNNYNALIESYKLLAELYEKQMKYKKSNKYYKAALLLVEKGGEFNEN